MSDRARGPRQAGCRERRHGMKQMIVHRRLPTRAHSLLRQLLPQRVGPKRTKAHAREPQRSTREESESNFHGQNARTMAERNKFRLR